jgi:carotenoid 1,2-hydratase
MKYRHASVASQTGPNFAASLVENGYAWWYIDALSDCGAHGLTIIAMLGCVFSPWYAAARRRGPTDPLAHPALNIALYGKGGHRWALTERGRGDLERTSSRLVIGPSSLEWDGTRLKLQVEEITSPWPGRLRGTVTLQPDFTLATPYAIDQHGRHLWVPIAPHAKVAVDFSRPALRWQGRAYLDANEGTAPLEADFDGWDWSRAAAADCSRIFYDTRWVKETGGRSLSLRIDATGRVESMPAPPVRVLPRTGWGIARSTRCDADTVPKVLDTLESGPFYARSLVETRAEGRQWTAFHESVSLRRFAKRWVQTLLPVKLPRRARR